MDFKEILTTLDLPADIDSMDKFKEHFQKKFVSKATAWDDEDIRKKATGQVTGILTRKIAAEFELSDEDLKEKKIEDIISLSSSKYKSKIEDLTKEGKKDYDQKLADYETKTERLKKEAMEFKAQNEGLVKTYSEKENEWKTEKKNWAINSVFSKAKESVSVNFNSDVDDLKKLGFDTLIANKYKFDLSETDGEILVYDKSTNKRVENTDKLGSFYSVEEILKKEAAVAGLIKMNDANAQRQQTTTVTNNTQRQNNTQNTEQKLANPNISPRAKQNLGIA